MYWYCDSSSSHGDVALQRAARYAGELALAAGLQRLHGVSPALHRWQLITIIVPWVTGHDLNSVCRTMLVECQLSVWSVFIIWFWTWCWMIWTVEPKQYGKYPREPLALGQHGTRAVWVGHLGSLCLISLIHIYYSAFCLHMWYRLLMYS